MSEAIKSIPAQPRTRPGSQCAHQLRGGGQVPAVVYGHKEAVLTIAVPHDDMWKVIRQGARIIDVQMGGKSEHCLVQEVQWDHLGKEIQHVDFKRVSADEKVQVTVPVQLRGTSPGVAAGGVVNLVLHDLHIECLVINIPETLRVNISDLQLDGAIHIKELVLPEGVKVLGDPDEVVVQCVPKVEEAEPAPGEAGAVEPEVITARKPDEKGDED
ncbi:MAG TPA: 50S ribosomal protein L25 [Gemmatales bacterium]|nr:50S ribosomal protein L25 [Gemmatales bacterium]